MPDRLVFRVLKLCLLFSLCNCHQSREASLPLSAFLPLYKSHLNESPRVAFRRGGRNRPGDVDAGFVAEQVASSSRLVSFLRAEPTGTAAAVASGSPVSLPVDVSSPTELSKFIREGPLFGELSETAGNEQGTGLSSLEGWEKWGRFLASALQTKYEGMSVASQKRIFWFYLPVFFWVMELLRVWEQRQGPGKGKVPLVLGMSAPQGCGKTTLVTFLKDMLAAAGKKSAVVSVDDFYLRGSAQDELAEKFPSNGLLRFRGNAGSHDLQLGCETLESLRKAGPSDSIPVPFYDKSLRGGRGDRAPESEWGSVSGPLDLVLFEGWMLGFPPVESREEAIGVDPNLEQVNENLRTYDRWHGLVDAWMVVEIADPQCVFKWRQQQEEAMKRAGKPGMSEEQVRDFVDRFMPAYRLYLPPLYSIGPHLSEDISAWAGVQAEKCRALRETVGGQPRRKPILTIPVDAERNPYHKDSSPNGPRKAR